VVILKNTGQIIQILNAETSSLFSQESVRIYDIQEINNVFWITTGEGLFSARKQKRDSFQLQKHDFNKQFGRSNQLGSFTVDKQGRFWICSIEGLVIYEPSKHNLLHAGNNPSHLEILNERYPFAGIYLDEPNNLVHYTTWEPSEKIFDLRTNKIISLYSGKGTATPDYNRLISKYLKDKHGTIWATSGGGLKLLNIRQVSSQTIANKKDNTYSLPTNDVTALLIDKEGSLWVGTTEGISITQPYNQSLVNLSTNNADRFQFAKMAVTSIIPVDRNCLLVGTQGGDGLYRTDSTFKVQEHYSFGSINYDWIWKYYRQGDSILISTQKGNLIYHVTTKKLEKLLTPPFDTFYPVFSFTPGKNGTIWVGRYINDFLEFDPRSGQYHKYSLTELGETSSVFKIASDRENNLWLLSSIAGVIKFDPSLKKITEYLPLHEVNGLLDSHTLFLIDVGDDLLIGYVAHGISLYNKKTKKFRHFSRADGLVSNSVTSAVQTDNNTVWITSRNGISRFDLQTKTFLNYNYDNGILQNDFSCISELADGRLAAGNKIGLVYFHPSTIHEIPQLT
ncbi:MAG: two-component regulator propeller domain-containing protein, partial [Flavisolibacter sp.]